MAFNTQNLTARQAIVSLIRSSLAASEPYDIIRDEHHPSSTAFGEVEVVNSANFDGETVVVNFCESLDLIGTSYVVAASEVDAAAYLNKVLDDTKAKTVVVSNSETVGTVTRVAGRSDFILDPTRETLFESDLGITSAQWAIAETGTLVLESDSEDHRLISLVPAAHLCIIKASRIRQTLGEILELTSKNLSRTVTFITGASRTSDIELTLAIGVHGPGELHVIVIADQ